MPSQAFLNLRHSPEDVDLVFGRADQPQEIGFSGFLKFIKKSCFIQMETFFSQKLA